MLELRQTEEFAGWLKQLRDRKAVQQIAARLTRMQLGNFGDAKPAGEGVSEARIHYGPGYRLYFIRRGEALIVLLCGGDKSSQQRDIARAIALAKEIKS
jgi:putative addiction module killer protein